MWAHPVNPVSRTPSLLRSCNILQSRSFSFYLWQQFFLLPEGKYPLSLLQRFPMNCILLFLVAIVSYKFVERPMISVGHRLAPPLTPGRTDLEPMSSIPLVEPTPSGAQSGD
jgi:peptidoglycan/LPS O-acetylase OafA/YrhL